MNIDKKVDALISPQKKRSRRGIGMRKSTLVGIVIVLGAILSITVSAVILDHFGEGAKAELDIDQSVTVNGMTWEESQVAPGETFEGVAGCCYGLKDKIENRGCVGGTLEFEDIVTGNVDQGEVVVTHYVVPGWTTLTLENKDPDDWSIYDEDEIWAELTFNPCCPEFCYNFDAYGLADTDYILIYYADQIDDWGGNPALKLGVFTASSGEIHVSDKCIELDRYLPYDDDYNLVKSYAGTPDNYVHAHGAKIWLIPLADWDEVSGREGTMNAWNPTTYLFETDLVFYFDCDLEPPYWDFNILDCVLGDSITSMEYYIEPYEEICLITYWYVDWASSGGLFNVKTLINPITPP